MRHLQYGDDRRRVKHIVVARDRLPKRHPAARCVRRDVGRESRIAPVVVQAVRQILVLRLVQRLARPKRVRKKEEH